MTSPAGVLRLFAIFHLNLAYSSIEEAQRPDVVQRCYWPLLRLAERTGAPIGIEASAFTLETAAAIDPRWLAALKRLIADRRCEFLGSGVVQLIGPLVPAAVNAANLRLGHRAYERLLGFTPRLAYVNEQAYSAGMVQHYIDASYDAMVMEWDNPARCHGDWNPEWRYFPQRACGQYGETIPLIWNKALAFQQFQRYAHDESSLTDYLGYLAGHRSNAPRALAMYGNDAEIFDFRPGRYHTEAALASGSEWARIDRLFDTLIADPRFELIAPSDVLQQMDRPEAGHLLHLESAEDPTPVKKQRKYNITRWAVTGRDNLGINTACWRIYTALAQTGDADRWLDDTAAVDAWRELCELWSSDYRTHITDARWRAYQARLQSAVTRRGRQPAVEDQPATAPLVDGDPSASRDGVMLTVRTPAVTLVLNCRRGLAIQSLAFGGSSLSRCGTLKHGFYDDIHWGADFYSGMIVMESPGRSKTTDLNRVEPTVGRAADGAMVVEAAVQTDLGIVIKTIRLAPDRPSVELTYRFEWTEIPVGSLRLGDITLNPRAFDRATLFYRSHNGGRRPERFPLSGGRVAHGDAVSFLVSASHAVGITEGMIEVGDDETTLRIEVDKSSAALVGMVTYQPIHDSYFCRVSFSAAEVDETRRATALSPRNPLVCRFRISPGEDDDQAEGL